MVGVASPWTVIGSETDISFTGDSPAALTALAGVEFTPVDVLVGVAGVSGISGSSKFGTAEDECVDLHAVDGRRRNKI